MALQPRAEATRQLIIETAVDLFSNAGYSNVVVADIINKAHITKGAFYYHFPTKAHLVDAIHDEAQRRFMATIQPLTAVPMSSLERLIRGSFITADLITRDMCVRLSSQLWQAQIHAEDSAAAQKNHTDNHLLLSGVVAAAATEGDLQPCDLDALMGTLGTGMMGVLMSSDTRREPPYGSLAEMWRVLLPGITAPDVLPFYVRLVDNMERHYSA